ncbi:MAG: type II secretion system GspH family protein [Blastocatellia bacterium]|nr:type II secretion system GspH family protein [Blastocatellia bacterium]
MLKITAKRKKQNGFTLIEILIAIVVVAIVGSAILSHIRSLGEASKITAEANGSNLIAENLAQKLARDRIPGPKSGIVYLTQGGKVVVDPETPPDGTRYTYEARLNVQANGNVYVLVTVDGPNKTSIDAGAQYRLAPVS